MRLVAGAIYNLIVDNAGGDFGIVCVIIGPARWFSASRNRQLLAMSEPAPLRADGDHYREIAGKLRELARYTRSPGIRRELVEVAKRYDRRGDYFDDRSG